MLKTAANSISRHFFFKTQNFLDCVLYGYIFSGQKEVRLTLLGVLFPVLTGYQLLLRQLLRSQGDREEAVRRVREGAGPLLRPLQDVSLYRGLLVLLVQEGGVAEAGQRLLERVSLYLCVVQEAVSRGMGDRAHQPLCRSKL
jgi:hypothetical protein